jgi:hypothetical protein
MIFHILDFFLSIECHNVVDILVAISCQFQSWWKENQTTGLSDWLNSLKVLQPLNAYVKWLK